MKIEAAWGSLGLSVALVACGPTAIDSGGDENGESESGSDDLGSTGTEGSEDSGTDTGSVEPELWDAWLLFYVFEGSAPRSVVAVELGDVLDGEPTQRIELIGGVQDQLLPRGRTSWGAYAFLVDGEIVLLDLDAEGTPEAIVGRPPELPAPVDSFVFAREAEVAIVEVESSFFWVRYQDGGPVEAVELTPPGFEYYLDLGLSPGGEYGLFRRWGGDVPNTYRHDLLPAPEPEAALALFPDLADEPVAQAVFAEHIFARSPQQGPDLPWDLLYIDMSATPPEPGWPVTPASVGAFSRLWFAPEGQAVVILDAADKEQGEPVYGELSLVRVIEGVADAPLALSEAGEVVQESHVDDSSWPRLAWFPLADQNAPRDRLRWLELAGDEVGAIHELDDGAPLNWVRWSADGEQLAWTSLGVDESWVGVAPARGPEAGAPTHLELPDARLPVWTSERLVVVGPGPGELWSTRVDAGVPEPLVPVDHELELGSDLGLRALEGVDAVVVSVDAGETNQRLAVIAFDEGGAASGGWLDDSTVGQRWLGQLDPP